MAVLRDLAGPSYGWAGELPIGALTERHGKAGDTE